jgi:hypothetical protein
LGFGNNTGNDVSILYLVFNALRWRRTKMRVFRAAMSIRETFATHSIEWTCRKARAARTACDERQALFYEEVALELFRQQLRLRLLETIARGMKPPKGGHK